ncbi:hypothetical protein MRX96_029444 [Rhipicephalus microplus]
MRERGQAAGMVSRFLYDREPFAFLPHLMPCTVRPSSSASCDPEDARYVRDAFLHAYAPPKPQYSAHADPAHAAAVSGKRRTRLQ